MLRAPDSLTQNGHNFYFYREYFPEGQFAGYKADDGEHFRFWVDGEILTPNMLADHLVAQYEQQSESGIRAAMSNYAGLRALPA